MSNTTPIHYEREIPDILGALGAVQDKIATLQFDRQLYHLVVLRSSQINRCGFCVDMHTREARDDGETNERLDKVVVWDQVSVFSEREKAALAWTEALTTLDNSSELGQLRGRLRAHFSDNEISALTAMIAMINLWNRLQISRH